ncbi:hypothetical protein EE612_036663 [Oryza sativa]|nr:hypothetical protein EE612_036663 [Oryza sativa]
MGIVVVDMAAAWDDERVVGGAEEEGHGEALQRGVGHHPVLHALVHIVAPRLQEVADVDDEGAGAGLHGHPPAALEQLEAADGALLLVHDGEQVAVRVRAQPESPPMAMAHGGYRFSRRKHVSSRVVTIVSPSPAPGSPLIRISASFCASSYIALDTSSITALALMLVLGLGVVIGM